MWSKDGNIHNIYIAYIANGLSEVKHCECWRRYICRVFNDEWNRILVSSEWRGETAGTASPCSAHFRLKAFTALDETDGDGTRQSREMHLLLHHVIHHVTVYILHVIHHMNHSYYSSYLSSWCHVFIILYIHHYIFIILHIHDIMYSSFLFSSNFSFIILIIYAFIYGHHTTYHHSVHSSYCSSYY